MGYDAMNERRVVKALNIATGQNFYFSPSYRCVGSTTHLFAAPHFTDATAFTEVKRLGTVNPGEIVFIEWHHDRFYALDRETGEHIVGPTVWRISQVLEHVTLPDQKET